MHRDENLLFGVFAVQLRKITPGQLAAAAGAWAADPTSDLGGRLVEDRVLSEADRDFVQRLVDEAVRAHEGNAEATLAAVGGREQVYQSFAGSLVVTDSGGIETIAAPAAVLDELAGTTIPGVPEAPGRYTTHSEYARGGMGRVLLVHDLHLGRDIALKELLPHLLNHSAQGAEWTPVRKTFPLVARFLQEARITGQLEHPGIVPVYELGHRSDGSVYYTMKLVRGKTLAQAIREAADLQGRIALLPHFVHLCNAIAYAHSRKVIHRDIKPGNIMVGEFGETVVLDWGLAKAKDKVDVHADGFAETLRLLNMGDEAAFAATQYGQALGTPVYMPPEQARGDLNAIDERSDVYSLGAVLFETLAGVVPFDGTSVKDILTQVLTKAPRDIAEFAPDAPAELVTICAKAMAKDPADRYGSAKDLAHDIERFQSGALVGAYTYTPREVMARFVRRHRPLLAVAVTSLLLIIAATGTYTIRIDHSRRLADTQRKLAMEAIASITIDMPKHFADIPGTAKPLQELYERNVGLIEMAFAADKDSQDSLKYQYLTHLHLGRGFDRLGRPEDALKSYESALKVIDRVASQNPLDALFQRGSIYLLMGEAILKVQDRPDDALRSFESAKASLVQLLELEPSNIMAQRLLSACNYNAAKFYVGEGNITEARHSLESSIEISNQLFEQDPLDIVTQRSLLASKKLLAELHTANGEHSEASVLLESSLKLAKGLVEIDKNSSTGIEDFILTCARLGEAYVQLDRPSDAMPLFETALQNSRHLLLLHPTNVKAAVVGGKAGEYMANIYASQGRLSEALHILEKSIELVIIHIEKVSPPEALLQNILLACYTDAGDIYTLLDRPAEALDSYKSALETAELVAKDERYRSAIEQIDIRDGLKNLGDSFRSLHHYEEALIAYTASLEWANRLAELDPFGPKAQSYILSLLSSVGDVQLRTNRIADAVSSYKSGMELANDILEQDASKTFAPEALYLLETRIGTAYYLAGDFQRANETFMASTNRTLIVTGVTEYVPLFLWCSQARIGNRGAGDLYLRRWFDGLGSDQRSEWVGHIAAYLLKEIDAYALLNLAENASDSLGLKQLCEAHFYIGTVNLLDGAHADAKVHFEKCLELDLPQLVEYQAARAELHRMKRQS